MEERFETYNENVCWQYNIRTTNLQEDLKISNLMLDEVNTLKCGDFTFQNEDKKKIFNEVNDFIKRHEWLGKLSLYPTHFFTARYKGILGGVVIMDMPNAFSKLLGENTRKIERLISRGACVSWSPKNLASKLISFSIDWMVKNTEYRLFTAYSDTEAKELGTIYQACNFYYLGKKSGSAYQYKLDNGKWTSDRYFRSRSVYKRLAIQDGIVWDNSWQNGDSINFDLMPLEIKLRIKNLSKEYQNKCEKRKIEPKHKYAYIKGKCKNETKQLKKLFEERNKIYQYPKERGK